jgi:hypothetical protein
MVEKVLRTGSLLINHVDSVIKNIQLRQDEIDIQRKDLDNEIKLSAKKEQQSFPSKITLDIGGTKFSTTVLNLKNQKSLYFSTMFSGAIPIQPCQDGSYFIDRNPDFFPLILDYIRGEEIDTEDFTSKELKLLSKEANFYHCIEFVQLLNQSKGVTSSSNLTWTNGAHATITEGGKRATATGSACYVFVNEPIKTSKKQSIKISIDTKTNAWVHIAFGKQKSFPQLGYYHSSQNNLFQFMYHVNQGSVNGKTGFPAKGVATIELFIDKNQLTFTVDGVKQEGSWVLEEESFLVCDPYHTGSTVLLH